MAEQRNDAGRCAFDHLILGAPSLGSGLDWCKERMATALTPGGSHPGRGTCNALLPLADSSYLELLAPDPEQPDRSSARAVLEQLREPAFTWWCLRTGDLEGVRRDLVDAGVTCGPIIDMGRQAPAGQMVKWRLFFTLDESFGARLPFFIDWGETPHPSAIEALSGNVKTISLAGPGSDVLRKLFEMIGYEDERLAFGEAAGPSMTATLTLGNREIVLHSAGNSALPPLR